jgi:PAS domain S-box-containing protein
MQRPPPPVEGAFAMELSGYALSPLRAGTLTLFRGVGDRLAPILLVSPAGECPSPSSLQRLEHEYALRNDLDGDWAARPVELLRDGGRLMLVLADPGGEPLEGLLGRPMEVTEFLRIAVSLAAAVGRLHARGLIHKDLKPANILIDTASGSVWLSGFGITSRLPREHQPPAPPEVIAGTLAYMAPEQTGRMNRSVDSRSDLYALGVTLYEMLTGALPFTAADPMEWVHCHIARQPAPPGERVAGVPAPLSAIVMKLLAKTAEDRYQTAAGLIIDLKRCLAEWQATFGIESFLLGRQDASDRLLIPERLYGREREIDTLLAAFDRVVADGTPQVVLVSGYSGIGKSSVVNELHRVLVPPRGLFASGKFDQYKRDIPYATLAQAFRSLVRPLLGLSEAALGRWREALSDALGPNGQLIVNLVPELVFVIGEQLPAPDLPPHDAQNRFQMVFRRFLGVFARKEHPLALFLDDLQWLDTATLELIEHLVTHSEVQHLLLVGAYRDNEVDPAHPLIRTFQAIRDAGARVEEIVLTPLRLDDVGRLNADALHCKPERARPLAQLVHEKTSGNPFFVIQFLTALNEEGLLALDPVAPAWQWDIDRIRAKSYTDNVVDLVVGKLIRLPEETQEALKQLACLGNDAEIATLTMVHGEPEQTIHGALWEAVHAGLVLRLDTTYKFLHDRIQQAAYSLIAEEERVEAHLRIGRVLLASMTADQLAEHLFDVANQLNRGAARLIDQDEKAQVATIDLRAGRKAKASAAYASACGYLAAGMALLDERDWISQYELLFSLMLERAECELLTGHFEKAGQLVGELLLRGASKVDQAATYHLKVLLHTARSENAQAVISALSCLRLFGIDLSAHPTWEQVQAEYETVWHILRGRQIESLTDLPLVTDPERVAAMQVLSVLAPPAYSTDFHLFCLLACCMANVGMQHGICGASAHGFGYFGSILGPVFHRYSEGYRFAALACDLVKKHGFIVYQAKIYHAMGSVAYWTQPLGTAIDFMRAAYRTATEMGDLTSACSGMYRSITFLLLRNDPLDAVWRESEKSLDFVRKAKFHDTSEIIVCQQRFIATMQGRTASFSTFSEAQFDEATFEAQLIGDRMTLMICFYWILKLKARFLSCDYAEALAAADNAKALLWTSAAHIQLLDYFFYTALTVAALYDNATADVRTGWRSLLMAHQEKLREWAENYPPTFGDKHALVSAEIARLEGRDADAMRLYEQAIQLAREHGFVQNEALALEVAARFYTTHGVETIANTYLRSARNRYDRWGALGKVKQFDECYPHLREEPTLTSFIATIGAPVGQLDVETVVKASQAVSGEIVLGNLIKTLMVIAVEHAGGERGLLVLPRAEQLWIEAEATSGLNTVEVNLQQTLVTSSDLPESILQYVTRTKEPVILDDASKEKLFSTDKYIIQKHARSVLCLPLIKQTKLVGVLYIENNLAVSVFTPARIAVLKLLSSQAAISLENARLYTALQRSEASLTEAQQISHTGSWRVKVSTGEMSWSAEQFRILGFDPSATWPSRATFMERIHAEDGPSLNQVIERAVRERSRFQHEYRIVLPDGSVKHLQSVGQPDISESGDLEFVGTVMDITDRKRAEEALRSVQAELARVARLSTMGELAASISHEINQPLAAIVTNGDAGLRWLNRGQPDLDEARDAFSCIVRDAQRAGSVIRGLRALAQKSGPQMAKFDMVDAIQEVLTLTRSELKRHGVVLHTKLSVADRPVFGDRVQLQQVVLNLVMNGAESMSAITDRPKVLTISSEAAEPDGLLVAVEDTGTGLDPAMADRIFEPFFTTKSAGMGMGLSICRSIVDSHGGRLWVSRRAPYGAIFRFTVPGDPLV